MSLQRLLVTLAAGVAAAAPVQAEQIVLPAEIAYPEGIGFDPVNRTAYVAGTRDGVIAQVDLTTGAGRAVGTGFAGEIAGSAPGVLGIRKDGSRLIMGGGRSAKIFVAEAATGKLIKSITTAAPGAGNINDLAIVGRTAYFTDTLRPILWSVNLAGPLPDSATPWLGFAGTALQYGDGRNLNGIVATPDGKTLIVGQMDKGLLFAIDISSRSVTPIDLKGELVQAVDGLALKDDLLFVVRQSAAEIVTVRLASDLKSGTVIKRTRPAGLLWPATAALDGDALVVVNSQFDKRQADTAVRPFTLTRVPLSELGVN